MLYCYCCCCFACSSKHSKAFKTENSQLAPKGRTELPLPSSSSLPVIIACCSHQWFWQFSLFISHLCCSRSSASRDRHHLLDEHLQGRRKTNPNSLQDPVLPCTLGSSCRTTHQGSCSGNQWADRHKIWKHSLAGTPSLGQDATGNPSPACLLMLAVCLQTKEPLVKEPK